LISKNKGFQFLIGGVTLVVNSNSSILLDRMCSLLGPFAGEKTFTSDIIRISLLQLKKGREMPVKIPEGAVCFFASPDAAYYSFNKLWITDLPVLGRVAVNRDKGIFLGCAYSSALLESADGFENMLHPLWDLLRQKGIYVYHAAAVSSDNLGLLIAGRSGAGKSTLAVDMVSRGVQFMSDDRCFLHTQAGSPEIIAFPEPARVFPSNVNYIKKLFALSQNTGRFKISLTVQEYFPDCIKKSAPLRAVIFPHWRPGQKSRLDRLPPAAVVRALLPLTMLCFNNDISRQHFDFNCRLALEIPGADLFLGDDRASWHRLALDFLYNCREKKVN